MELGDVIKGIDYARSKRAKRFNNYALTELGKRKVEEYGVDGFEGRVMNDLDDNGPSTLREIAGRVPLEERRAKEVLEKLIAKQRVIRVAQ